MRQRGRCLPGQRGSERRRGIGRSSQGSYAGCANACWQQASIPHTSQRNKHQRNSSSNQRNQRSPSGSTQQRQQQQQHHRNNHNHAPQERQDQR